MRLNQLGVFLAVMEAGSVRAAARSLRISPPAVAKSLRRLEQDFQVALFERRPHGVVPTPAARSFLARARVVRAELSKAREEFARLSEQDSWRVAVGVGPTEMALLLPEAIAQFRKQFPQARVRIVEGTHQSWLPLVRDETLDLAIGLRPQFKLDAPLSFRPLFRSDFVIAGRKSHPLRDARSLAHLEGVEWLTLSSRGTAVGLLDRLFSSAQLRVPAQPLVECDSFAGVVAVVAKTDMLTLLARRLLDTPIAREQLREIRVVERLPSVTHGLFIRSDTPLTRSAAAMVKAVSSVGRSLARSR